ncbi:hypothetical protein EYF80_062122 [Liparis tanakae]|uniref:Uncharacterized protein n=1 Tax=Liparis tanakae TaxID=230148 RepID=A0A4Z2EGG5_9TELE|nr:hypothetical protein EYF80_062122 [Liparis tanakae]
MPASRQTDADRKERQIKDLQQPLHLGLRLLGVLFVPAHFLLQAGDAFGELRVGLGICRRPLSLEQKVIIMN